MGFPTIDAESNQYATITSVEADPLYPNESHGRIRLMYWNLTTGTQADNYVWALGRLPANVRILDGRVWFTANTGADFNFGLATISGGTTFSGYPSFTRPTVPPISISTSGSEASLGSAANSAGGAGMYDLYGDPLTLGLIGAVILERSDVLMTADGTVGTTALCSGYLKYVND